ncbi:glycosyhydrolase [Opitutaceae bacterium TAV5]|nr:glycosyhydrolase [Opitutaceae bacterium TAV5]
MTVSLARPSVPVKRVSVVFKTHLDIGFTDLAKNIVDRYLNDYIPGALRLARETRHSPCRFVWTTGSWLAYRFLDDASPSNRRLMEEAIRKGDFHWHALPFTTHSEYMTPTLFRAGLRYSALLDTRFGRKTRAAKMTDVPGHTIGIVPLLAEAGVRLLHIGVNPASTVPDVPPVFVWRRGRCEVVVIYEADYGGVIRLPGGRALCVNLTGDNLGPQNPGEIEKVHERLRHEFPGASIVPGGLGDISAHVWKHRDKFPVIESEIGDTWVHGIGTDPGKTARYRELNRLRERWTANGRLKEGSAIDLRLAESLLLTAEHTWGMDIKKHLADWTHYTAKKFARVRRLSNFRKLETSWCEQRRYTKTAVAALPDSLRREARAALARLRPAPFRSGSVWRSVDPAEVFRLGMLTLQLDPETGAIRRLTAGDSRTSLAGRRNMLGCFFRETYSKSDYERFYRSYIREEQDWSRKDFTKHGLPTAVRAATHHVSLSRLELHRDGDQARATLVFSPLARRDGVPPLVCLRLEADSGESAALHMTLDWFDKPAVRLPEAYCFSFHPRLPSGASWRFRKLGQWIDPADIVSKGSRTLHGIEGSVCAGEVTITSHDAPLVAPERPCFLEFDDRLPRADAGIAFNLFNNIWGTNFPMWSEGDARFRFTLRFRA